MPVSVVDIVRGTIGHRRMALVKVTFDNSYQAGGEPFGANAVGMTDFDAVFAENARLLVRYADGKLIVGGTLAQGGDLDEVSDGENLADFSVTLLCIGA